MDLDRRRLGALLLGLPFASSQLLGQGLSGNAPRVDAERIGMNTHIRQGERPERVLEALRFLGIRHIRDELPGQMKMEPFLRVLHGGVRLTAVVNGNRPLADTIAALETLEHAQPGSVAAIEGPNEVNNFHMSYKGAQSTRAAIAFQNDLFDAVRASPTLARLPVIAFTDLDLQDCKADFFNFHPYPQGDHPLSRRIAKIRDRVAGSRTPNRPIQFTEFGYSTVDVTEAQQADLIVGGLRDAIAAGIRRTFVYQLSDFYPERNADRPKQVNHYGVFDLQYRPKMAARALAQFMRS